MKADKKCPRQGAIKMIQSDQDGKANTETRRFASDVQRSLDFFDFTASIFYHKNCGVCRAIQGIGLQMTLCGMAWVQYGLKGLVLSVTAYIGFYAYWRHYLNQIDKEHNSGL